MAKQDDYVRYTIRVPQALYDRIQESAGDKSINAEILSRLSRSFDTRPPTVTLALEAFPQGTPPLKTTLAEFLSVFAVTLRETVTAEKKAAKAERRAEKEEAKKALLPPDHDYEG